MGFRNNWRSLTHWEPVYLTMSSDNYPRPFPMFFYPRPLRPTAMVSTHCRIGPRCSWSLLGTLAHQSLSSSTCVTKKFSFWRNYAPPPLSVRFLLLWNHQCLWGIYVGVYFEGYPYPRIYIPAKSSLRYEWIWNVKWFESNQLHTKSSEVLVIFKNIEYWPPQPKMLPCNALTLTVTK